MENKEDKLPIQNTPDKEPVTNCDQLSVPIERRILTSPQLRQDVARHNAQYPGVTLHDYKKAHDRFLIVDETVYHIGASLKDLGKKLFAFSEMTAMTGTELLERLKQLNHNALHRSLAGTYRCPLAHVAPP